jgi:hypothetical protein
MADNPLTAEEKAKRFADLMIKHGLRLTRPADMEKAMNQTVQGCPCGAPPGAVCKMPDCHMLKLSAERQSARVADAALQWIAAEWSKIPMMPNEAAWKRVETTLLAEAAAKFGSDAAEAGWSAFREQKRMQHAR